MVTFLGIKVFNPGTFDSQEILILLVFDANEVTLVLVPALPGHQNKVALDQSHNLQIQLMTSADAFVLAHNHPGGTTKPSEADTNSAWAIQALAARFGIAMLDDLIVTQRGYYSFAENHLLWGAQVNEVNPIR
jgi:DNA repair protein RadC